jgi:hypothetical protein
MFEESTQNKPLSILHSNNHLLSSPFIRTLIGSIRSYQDFCLETEGTVSSKNLYEPFKIENHLYLGLVMVRFPSVK